ncbi:hypothetical protein Rhopal_004847-T1 [Rhodotorula paludigena]|uniref:5'-deoxynucleotidase n=1 Tax=Rhodotorula paludigena TaxID=86838 RepID=A0AAV5GMW1_9BASI|nr:hypothetical protein Rhopal_004847-T1 [Rhodotorula paludigena]
MVASSRPVDGTPATPPVPLDCREGTLGFFHTLERLKTNKRTGWVNQGVDKPESIMDHMGRMALLCLAFPETASLDIGKCVMLSIVHDLAEADVGDITPEHASGVSKAQKLALEEKAMERIYGLLGHPSIASLRLKSLWEEYEARETPESKFVKDLDLYELCQQAVEYENSQGNRKLQEFFETTIPRIQHNVVKGWARELMACRRARWAERGWTDFKEVLPPPDTPAPTTNGTKATIPVRVYGEHAADEEAQ